MQGPTRLSHDSARGLIVVARVGYVAKGIVYSIMGALAVMFALGESEGELTDGKGAVAKLAEQPFGEIALWVIAVGLACYALWSAVRALLDPERKRERKHGNLKRIGYGLAAISHGALALYAGQLAVGAARSSGGGTQTYVAQVMGLPFGRALVAAGGVIALVFGLQQVWKATRDRIDSELRRPNMTPQQYRLAHVVERVGIGARGVVFAVIGSSFVIAAARANPSEAEGVAQALRELAIGPFGSLVLLVVAGGLVAYGVHQFVVARYARIPAPN